MKNKELIRLLQDGDPDAEVSFHSGRPCRDDMIIPVEGGELRVTHPEVTAQPHYQEWVLQRYYSERGIANIQAITPSGVTKNTRGWKMYESLCHLLDGRDRVRVRVQVIP